MTAFRTLAHILSAWLVGALIISGALCFIAAVATIIAKIVVSFFDPSAASYVDQLIYQAPGGSLTVNAVISAATAFVAWGIYRIGANEMSTWPEEQKEQPPVRRRPTTGQPATPQTAGSNDAGRK